MKQLFALGTYTEDILFGTRELFHGKGKGVLICLFDDDNGRITVLDSLPIESPS
ncbi:hypothetical protein [Lachnoclostridium sp. An169]|uniref:hypothetical protein n=1 Tax=Lachnoclostridium sp. An169 TaxID=1965569 RepID=UPI001FA925A4|nr:hypothetical protein [Lachnoclostridium sp. An169]